MRIPYTELTGTPEGILTLRALKAEPVQELLDDAIWDESLLFSISEDALERLLRYILNAELQIPKLRERIRNIRTQPLKHKAMTLADQLREEGKLEGKLEGKQEGKLEGKRESVLRALEIRHGGCPEGIRELVQCVNDPVLLDRLHESAFRSESLETFAREL